MIDVESFDPNVYWFFSLYPRIEERSEERYPRDLPPLEDISQIPIEEKYPVLPEPVKDQEDDIPDLSSEDENPIPLECENCFIHGFPCLNCAIPSVDGPGHHCGVRYICEEEDQNILDILFAWKNAHPYIPVTVISCWEDLPVVVGDVD